MKTRQGFVSNSSTTSFCIYGAGMTRSEIAGAARVKNAADPTGFNEYCKKYEIIDSPEKAILDDDVAFQFIEDVVGGVASLEFQWTPWDTYYIGLELTDIGRDETLAQFEKKAEELLRQVFGADVECSLTKKAFRDG